MLCVVYIYKQSAFGCLIKHFSTLQVFTLMNGTIVCQAQLGFICLQAMLHVSTYLQACLHLSDLNAMHVGIPPCYNAIMTYSSEPYVVECGRVLFPVLADIEFFLKPAVIRAACTA
jgi:hypothetical protein